MLVWERWTLTHSSGAAAVLAPALAALAGLELAATEASSVAEVVCDALELEEGVWSGVSLTLTGGGSALAEPLLAAGLLAAELVAAVAELVAELLAEGEGEGDGEGDGEGEGDGVGVGELAAGSAWHAVSVFDAVAAAAACAVPSMPSIRKLPLSKATAATLRCAKRITRIACLRCSFRVTVLS